MKCSSQKYDAVAVPVTFPYPQMAVLLMIMHRSNELNKGLFNINTVRNTDILHVSKRDSLRQ
jgi:hypothetical protein